MTFSNVLVAEKLRKKAVKRALRLITFLTVPAIAGGVFYVLNSQEQKPQVPPSHSAPASAETAVPSVPKPTNEAPKPIAIAAAAPVVVPQAPRADLPLRPVIRLSEKPHQPEPLPTLTRETSSIALTRAELATLHNLPMVDKSARQIADELKQNGDKLMNRVPIAAETFTARSEGEKAYLENAKQDLVDTMTLGHSALINESAPHIEHYRRHVLNWIRTYKPVGDPFSDAKLEPLLYLYGLTYAHFSADEQKEVERWLLNMGDQQVTEAVARQTSNDLWFAYHLQTIAYAGLLTANANYQSYLKLNFGVHLVASVRENGATDEFDSEDSISRDIDHVRSMLTIAKLLYRANRIEKDALPVESSSLARAIEFALPFALGQKPHDEFANPKSADFKLRQASDITLKPRPFRVSEAISFFETLAFFRPSMFRVLPSLYSQPGMALASPQSMITMSLQRNTELFEPPTSQPQVSQATPSTNLRQPSTTKR